MPDLLRNKDGLTEEEFLAAYRPGDYERPSNTVDMLLFTVADKVSDSIRKDKEKQMKVLLIKRKNHPCIGAWALPGGFCEIGEDLDTAARRELWEETGLKDIYFEQLYTWGEVKRDPRMRIISVSYMALVSIDQLCKKATNGNVRQYLHPVEEVLKADEVAFDHQKIIAYARERIKNKVDYSDIAFNFMPEKFTLPRLQKVYEILLDKPLYKANFRKKISPMVLETDESTSGDAHRPSKYYVKNPNCEE